MRPAVGVDYDSYVTDRLVSGSNRPAAILRDIAARLPGHERFRDAPVPKSVPPPPGPALQSLSGRREDKVYAVAEMRDGGFTFAGHTRSHGRLRYDAWLMRFDAMGKLVWERLYGRKLWDRPTSILATHDGGLMVTGYTTSRGAGYEDAWLLRLDENGWLGAEGRLERVVPGATPGVRPRP